MPINQLQTYDNWTMQWNYMITEKLDYLLVLRLATQDVIANISIKH